MPYDSQGNFYRVHNWEQDRINEIEIVSDRHDEEDDNFAEGLSNCLLKDGRTAMTGKLNMNNFKIQNVANATASKEAVNKSQLDAVSSAGVKLTGNQTIGGNKTFSGTTAFNANPQINNATPTLIAIENDVIKGQVPGTTQYAGISFRDSSGDATGALSRILAGYQTDKESWISLYAFQCNTKPADESGLVGAGLTMHYPVSGSPYATAPNSDVAGSVVTTKSISKAASGYVELGNGVIIQWGAASNSPVSFSKAFTTTCQVSGTCNYGGYTEDGHGYIYNLSKTGFEFRGVDGDMLPFHWIAIGY